MAQTDATRACVPASVELLVEQYLAAYPGEADQLAELRAFLQAHRRYEDQTRRSNMAGHLTVSGLIVDPARMRLLLVEHRTLGKRLQPGGHVEASDGSLLAAAYREIGEETGLSPADLHLIDRGLDPLLPVDINSHRIPASSSKGEPEHLHHDLRYLFVLARPQPTVMRSPEDGSELIWDSFQRALAGESQQHLPGKLQALLRSA